MRHQTSPQGKVYRFAAKDTWGSDLQASLNISKIVLKHMVIVVGKCPEKRGWVKVATVSITYTTIK